VRVNFVGFERVIDTIGGVEIDVPRGIDVPADINRPKLPDGDVADDPLYIPAGHHHLDGKLALKYARTRLGDSDFYRMKRQQQVIMAVRDRFMQLGWFRLVLRLPQLVDSMADAIQTDIPLRELVALARLARQIDRDHIEARTIDPSMTVPVTTPRGEQVLWPDWDKICPLVDELFGSPYSRLSAAGQGCGRKGPGCCSGSRR